MQQLEFPLSFTFKISSFANDFVARDAQSRTVAYVRQKMFKFKEEINIYDDEHKSNVLYKINADRWIDFSAAYRIEDKNGNELGKVARKGWASLWKAKYDIVDAQQKTAYTIREENAWIKVLDGVVGEIPVLGMFTGYMFNPAYIVLNPEGETVFRLKKERSLVGRRFTVNRVAESHADDELIMLSLMMMILLERRRG